MNEKSLIEQVDEILLVDAKRRIIQLETEINDWKDTFRIVLADECAPDERHCTCVPFLRARIAQFETENAALKRELTEWRKYHREATELAEAVSMSGNMRISVSDRAKMRAMDARLNALLTAEEQE